MPRHLPLVADPGGIVSSEVSVPEEVSLDGVLVFDAWGPFFFPLSSTHTQTPTPQTMPHRSYRLPPCTQIPAASRQNIGTRNIIIRSVNNFIYIRTFSIYNDFDTRVVSSPDLRLCQKELGPRV